MKRAIPSLILCLLLAGCGGQPTGEQDGFYTWVDESGQLRRTPIPDSDQSDAEAEESTASGDGSDDSAHPVYNLDNFPDGNEQLRQLEEQQPYFTWMDAEGNVYNTPYDEKAEAADPIIEPPRDISASDALVAKRGSGLLLGEGAVAEVGRILDLQQQSRLIRFSEHCCRELATDQRLSLGERRRLSVAFDRDQSHGFPERDSAYQLVRLPESAQGRFIRVRAFIRGGAFVPSFAFLDEDMEPTRLVTDIVFEHHPETWRRHAFLQAYLPLRELPETRWLVIYSEAEAGFESLLEGESGPVAIDHRPDATLELKVVEPDQPSGASLLNQGWDNQ